MKEENQHPIIENLKIGISGVPRIVEKILGPVLFGTDIPTKEDIVKLVTKTCPKIIGGEPAIGTIRRKQDIAVARDFVPTVIDVYAERKGK